ncbi:Oligopeptide transporter, putative [Yarrowia lipolytica]|jgi:OPT family small oligopeptide transporter|nr:Oligopeptide transporter, putative [Yarrowia lipolytica]
MRKVRVKRHNLHLPEEHNGRVPFPGRAHGLAGHIHIDRGAGGSDSIPLLEEQDESLAGPSHDPIDDSFSISAEDPYNSYHSTPSDFLNNHNDYPDEPGIPLLPMEKDHTHEKGHSDEHVIIDTAEVLEDTCFYVAYKLGIATVDDEPFPESVSYIALKVDEMGDEEALAILKRHVEYHKDDRNIPESSMLLWRSLIRHSEEYAQGNISESGEANPSLSAKKNTESTVDRVATRATYEDGSADLDPANMSPNELSLAIRYHAAIFHYWSPYIEVRSVTDPFDDPNLPVETIRAYLAGIIWLIVGAGVNQFFSVRMPAISISTMVCQLLLYPTGKALEYILPDKGFTFRGTRHSLNPGPWNNKEQMLATMFISVAIGGTYITSYNLFVQILPMYYGVDYARQFGYTLTLTLASQFMGFGFAGLLRKFVVYPTKAMWPTLMPTLALNRALLVKQKREKVHSWTISPYKFFFVVVACAFVYFWFPSYIFQALSTFNWITWIAPDNLNINIVTGAQGMGVNPWPTFDTNNMFALFDPLVLPQFTVLNTYAGMILGASVILGLYYTNTKGTAHLPINSNRIFDNTGKSYNVSRVLTDGTFDDTKYRTYSPPFYTAANLMVYSSFFAIYTLGFVYIGLSEWSTMVESFRDVKQAFIDIFMTTKFYIMRITNRKATRHDMDSSQFTNRQDEPFSRMIAAYPEVQNWVFIGLLVVSFVLAVIAIRVWPTDTPIWGLFFCLGINLVFLIPLTLILAYTGFGFGLNVLVQLIVGYALPGHPQAMMILKAIGYQVDGQAQNFITDQKVSYYTHMPPRALMRSQLIGTLVGAFVCLGVLYYQLEIEGICTPEQATTTKFTCVSQNTFFSASVIWGALGPAKMFQIYPAMKYMFLLGAVVGLIFWAVQYPLPTFLAKKFPQHRERILSLQSTLKLFNPVIFVGGVLNFAPYNLSYATGGLYVSLLFSWIKRRYSAWWRKYTYVLDAGLITGIAFSAIIIFFAVQYKGVELEWWGNTVSYDNLDFKGAILKPLAAGETFGPSPENFP